MLFLKFDLQKKGLKIENLDLYFPTEFNADSKTVFVFLLALIVFDFYSFEGSKTHFTGSFQGSQTHFTGSFEGSQTHFTGEANIYIYIYIHI